MAPTPAIVHTLVQRANHTSADVRPGSWREHANSDAFILEAWSEGCMVGALMIMSFVTLANMRRGVLLHKLILLEVRQESKVIRGYADTSSVSSYLP